MAVDNSLIVAGIGLLGVLVGGFITAGTNLFVAIRKERADHRREHNIRASEVSAAARIIRQELVQYRAMLDTSFDTHSETSGFNEELTSDTWDRYGPVLAGAMAFEVWFDLSNAYSACKTFPRVSRPNKESASRLSNMLKEGTDALAPYCRDPLSKGFPKLLV